MAETGDVHRARVDRVTTDRRHLVRWLGLAISVVAVALVIRSVDLSATLETLRQAALLPLLIAAVLVPIQVALVSFRWQRLLPRRADGRRPSYFVVFGANWLGYLGNLVLPARLGEVVRSFVVSRREALDLAETFGTAVLERIIDASSLAVIAALTAAAIGAPDWFIRITAVIAAIGGAAIVFLGLIGPHVVLRPLDRLVRRLGAGRRFLGVLRILDRLATGVSGVGRRRATLLAIALSTVNWLIEATIFVLVAASLGIELPPAAGLLIAAVTVLGTAVPSAPAYVGTYELAATAAATALGVPEADALALAIVAHTVTVVPLAIGGAISASRIDGGLRPLAERAAVAAEHTLDDEAAPS